MKRTIKTLSGFSAPKFVDCDRKGPSQNYYDFRNTLSAGPLIISTWATVDFSRAAQNAWVALRNGQNRLESLVQGLETCEKLQCDRTVGFGGSPDETGETTLDALIMDGPGQEMGAVGDLRRVKSAARVAWSVMNYTTHSFLAGDQATRFAVEMGFKLENLTTEESAKMHQQWLDQNCQPNFWRNVQPNSKTGCGPYKPIKSSLLKVARPRTLIQELERFSQRSHDTLGMVVVDENGDISVGTTTNGAGHKIPGRIGDSPIPGAGAYVDNDFGGAAATGDGDQMMRFLPSMVAVEQLRNGISARKAAQIAILRIKKYYPNFFGAIVVASKKGDYSAACSGMSRFAYSVPSDSGVHVETVRCE
uniref:N(4)-(beta-N-acetylglucosaminyl)-L-asparaginase n=1 Tax=Bursaphelenchus xylophilus TaxID=6326 RepID=A0A1I7SF62_BURXY